VRGRRGSVVENVGIESKGKLKEKSMCADEIVRM
jgi:hypothetical protein